MKKTILSVAILLASTLGLTAVAQTPANSQACPNSTECTKANKANKPNRPNPFEGLNLTEQQKTELKAIAPQRNGQKCNKAANGTSSDKAQTGKCCKDKKAKDVNAASQSKAEKQAKQAENRQKRMDARRDYLAKVKNILTPEQYVQFLENNYVDQGFKGGPRHGKMAHSKKGHARKGNKNGNRGNKQNMNQQAQPNANDSNSAYYIDNGKIKVFPYHAQR